MESLGPVTGEHGALLSFQLAALRGNATQEYATAALGSVTGELRELLSMEIAILRGKDEELRSFSINLPHRWGRDPRVLDFLREERQHRDEKRRQDAVVSLCVLGELEPAMLAVDDPSPGVRAQLARVLGTYREEDGVEVLNRLLDDHDSEVARQAKAALRLLRVLEMPVPMQQSPRTSAWGHLLGEISRLRLTDQQVAISVTDDKVISCWLGERGATEEEIASAEQRLGAKLPPSYRTFLMESNGFEYPDYFISRLYGTGKIDWFRIGNQDWIDAYQVEGDISPQEHLNQRANCVAFRRAYLSSCLQISDECDGAVVLLNPEVVTTSGEWETWFFANWLPGANRYASFREFMEAELNEFSDSDR